MKIHKMGFAKTLRQWQKFENAKSPSKIRLQIILVHFIRNNVHCILFKLYIFFSLYITIRYKLSISSRTYTRKLLRSSIRTYKYVYASRAVLMYITAHTYIEHANALSH